MESQVGVGRRHGQDLDGVEVGQAQEHLAVHRHGGPAATEGQAQGVRRSDRREKMKGQGGRAGAR
jgi:hypothetical protein